MILGNGLVASEFKKKAKDYEGCVVFATGVSNSGTTTKDEFNREKLLLTHALDKYKDVKFIYFSTILVGFVDNAYYRHKAEMEKLIEKKATSYLIFRVPQLVGLGGNKNNLINYFKTNIQDNKTITIYEGARRSFMDIEDVVKIVYYCIEKVKAIDLCTQIGRILEKSPKMIKYLSDEITGWEEEGSALYFAAIADLKIDQKGYTQRILEKYLK